MSFYATNRSPGYPDTILQFDSELDRDDFTSRKPGERATADAPQDLSGFRKFDLYEKPGRHLHCHARALTPEELATV